MTLFPFHTMTYRQVLLLDWSQRSPPTFKPSTNTRQIQTIMPKNIHIKTIHIHKSSSNTASIQKNSYQRQTLIAVTLLWRATMNIVMSTGWWRGTNYTEETERLLLCYCCNVIMFKYNVWRPGNHYDDVIMGTIASQITSLTGVYSTVYSGADQSKHQSSASLAFVWGIHRGPVNSPHKWPVTRKMFPFDYVIMTHDIFSANDTF